jgi:hypothetical protein
LRFASAGPDAVVDARFVLTGTLERQTFGYVGLWRRRHGRLFIRLEHARPSPNQER